ncbi:MAG: hypothetical protein ACT4NU_00335 [Chromatiales bacterium]
MMARNFVARLGVAVILAAGLVMPNAALADHDSTPAYFSYGYPAYPVVQHYYVPAYSAYYCPPPVVYYSPRPHWGGHGRFYGHRKFHSRHHHHYDRPSYSYYAPRPRSHVRFGFDYFD